MKMVKLVKSQETTLELNPNYLDQIDKEKWLMVEVPNQKNPNIVNVNVDRVEKITPAKN